MNKIIFLGFFFTLQIATAQTIVEPTIPATGMTYPVTIMNDTMAFGNPPWDFSIYNPTMNADIDVLPIASSSNASNYPNATHVKYEDGYEFFLGFNNAEYTFHGEVSIITSSYPTSLVMHPYPFNVGDTHSDSELNIPFTVPGGPPSLERDDQAFSEAVSSGSIIMPDGTTHNNATLVHTTRTWTDGQTGSSPCVTTLNAFHWWVPGYAIPVVQSSSMVSTGQCPPNSVYVTKFLVGNPMGIKNTDMSVISIYPNPTSNTIQLSKNDPFQRTGYVIHDQLGKIVYSGILSTNSNKIDVSTLSKGIYLLILEEKTKQVLRFVKD